MTTVRKRANPHIAVAVVHMDTSCPSGWSQTTANADNLAAFIQNSTWVLARNVDVVEVPMDRMANPLLMPWPVQSEPRSRGKYHKYRLEDLTAELRPETRHQETEWGKPAGKEVW